MMKRYEERNGQTFKIEVRYSIGGNSGWGRGEEARGYYLHVTPVKIEDKGGYRMEIMTAFSGYKYLLIEVKRQSKKAEESADKLAETMVEELIQACLIKQA